MKKYFYITILSLLICSQAFGANMYWKSSLAELNAITGATNADKGIVMDSNHAVTFYDHLGGAWAVAKSHGAEVDIRDGYGTLVAGAGASTAQRTANTATINAAIVAARASGVATCVVIPSMFTYYINGTINLLDGVTLSGTSKWYGGLATTDNIVMVSSDGLGYLHVENLALTGPAIAGSVGIKVPSGGSRSYIANIYARYFGSAIETWADTLTIINPDIDNASTAAINIKTVGNAVNIYDPHLYNSATAIKSGQEGGCRGINVWGGVIQGNTLGITGNANTYSLSVNGTYFEGQVTQDIQYSGNRLFINGGDFVSNSGTLTDHIYSDSPHTTIIAPHFKYSTEPSGHYVTTDSSAADALIINPTWETTPTTNKKYSIAGARSSITEGGVSYQSPVTFADNATTPSVAGGTRFKTANTGSTTITNLLNGVLGQRVEIVFTDNVTTLQNNSALFLAGATNFVATPNDMITLTYTDGIGWVEKGRSVN